MLVVLLKVVSVFLFAVGVADRCSSIFPNNSKHSSSTNVCELDLLLNNHFSYTQREGAGENKHAHMEHQNNSPILVPLNAHPHK